MNKLSILLFFCFAISNAQFTQKEDRHLDFNSKKESLIEKEIIKIGEFKDLTFQKIIFKDLSDDSILNVFGIMIFQETFNSISKKTITLDKEDLSKLIDSIQKIEQKSKTKPENEIKYKYLTENLIEVGSNYNPSSNDWNFYLKLPHANQGIIKFSQNDLKDLLKLLKSVEENL